MEEFNELVQSIRDIINWIDDLPDEEIDPPLAELGRNLKACLEAYDSHR